MKNNRYDEIIDRLRQIAPVPASATRLTDGILNSIEKISGKKKRYILLRANEKQWFVFNSTRTLMTTAAALLIGFFIIQQVHINTKLKRLEKEVVILHQPPNLYAPDRGQLIHAIYNEFHAAQVNPSGDSVQNEILQINRKSLNYMLREIQRLQNENRSFREKIQKIYPDSTYLLK